MYKVQTTALTPGTVLRVRSTRFPAVMHWGVVGYGQDSMGCPPVWHSQKSDVLRCTGFEEFSGGQACEILLVPDSPQQASWIIERLQSQEGLPWHLTNANCETVVRWAVENKAVSHQVTLGAVCAIGVGIFVAAVVSK